MNVRRADLLQHRVMIAEQNAKLPAEMTRVPTGGAPSIKGVWRSNRFLAVVYRVKDHPEMERITVNRSELTDDAQWVDGVTWDELMAIKAQMGRGDRWAVEVYPPDDDVVNVSNMRHLWLLEEKPTWAWDRTNR